MGDNAISYGSMLVLSLLLLLPLLAKGCDMFTGQWVKDPSYPLYDPSTCPFIRREFEKWTAGSRLPYLQMATTGMQISMVQWSDSLSLNQWQSLTCMLHSSVPKSPYTMTTEGTISTFTFQEYGVGIKFDRNPYLVDIVSEKIGSVMKLDSINDGKNWLGMDTLIFNTWHWWSRKSWDYIQIGSNFTKDMDRMAAFEIALGTWGKWVDTVVDTSKTRVFFQGISPSHYNGSLWGEPAAHSCAGQTEPLWGTSYPGGLPPEVGVLKRALGKITKPVTLLDITMLSLLRKDGHPSIYGIGGRTGNDCSHWCLSGVPDTWNEILYNYMLYEIKEGVVRLRKGMDGVRPKQLNWLFYLRYTPKPNHPSSVLVIRIGNLNSETTDSEIHSKCLSIGSLEGLARINEDSVEVSFRARSMNEANSILELKMLNEATVDHSQWMAEVVPEADEASKEQMGRRISSSFEDMKTQLMMRHILVRDLEMLVHSVVHLENHPMDHEGTKALGCFQEA
ncbi:LOW QUALITY PROTEIN: hypothetical protein HID58_019488 [Brassica napus]|uniref:Uncharacterized protein n=1 Tax=Brassica napus TaxID=3708 RepID=A0ABQ8DE42_BRANA|nr:LOW QUALITY PROTEIN: hypothetical protein HID58_019488 [Brassica napus]